ncbi:MAG: tRNA-dihydrouridine synthase [Candidatus Pacebacteria bacterium]|nr:tRNA-dihydrouridine synthase [Candidatus Paceibacterota bacterium]
MNFWQQLPAPFFVVAPMADVTDAAFRRMLAKHGKPDVMWTEFVAADGLVRATPEGRAKLMADLIYAEEERPIVAQLFSSNEAHMEYAADLCRELGFDGIDINMGCPDRSIEKQGCGSAMIKTPDVARAIIRAAKRGAGDLPVSVKTRIGYNKDEIDTWIPALLAEKPAVLTIHARTRKEMSKVPAQWERVVRVVELRDKFAPDTRIIGNGDILSIDDARQKVAQTGADGAMIGRALFGNPWFFHPTKRLPIRLNELPTHGVDREKIITQDMSDGSAEYISLEERLLVMVEHTKLFSELLPHKNFAVMKKHYKAYVNGFYGAATLRAELMEQNNAEDVERVVHAFLSTTDLNALD